MRRETYDKVRFACAATAVLFLMAAGILVLNLRIREELDKSVSMTLEEIMQQQAFNFTSKMNETATAMVAIAELYPFDKILTEETKDILKKLVEKTKFDSITILGADGIGISNTGASVDISDSEEFKYIIRTGNPAIAKPSALDMEEDGSFVFIGAPVSRDGRVLGIVLCAIDSKNIDELLLPSFGDKGYVYITDSKGNMVVRTVNSYSLTPFGNLFSSWKKASFYDGDNLETILKNLSSRKSGNAKYMIQGQKRLVHYADLGIGDWYIFTVVPDEVISGPANRISMIAQVITSLFVLAVGVLIYWIIKIQKAHINELSSIAYCDELTGAPTLAKFKIEAQQIIFNNPGMQYILVKFDVDGFKFVNQTLGYTEGDRMLCGIASALKSTGKDALKSWCYGKVNIDEFIVIFPISSDMEITQRRRQFIENFEEYMGKGFGYKVKFPAGVHIIRSGERDISSAIEKVNFAHRKAKQKDLHICFYDDLMRDEALREKEIENHMDSALANGEFKVFLQPKYHISSNTVAGAEALVRWRVGNDDIVYPGSFIPVFERNGFITKLDMYMFESVCKIIRSWIDTGLTPVTVSVNFSRNHLSNSDLVKSLCELADKYGVPRQYLEIELTESAIFDNENKILELLKSLHEAHFTLSMDDFGAGYSSLGLLKNIPVDVLKIDGEFFKSVEDTERANTVIAGVMRMARELNIKTVAEGVETKEHVDLLRTLGCDMVQGYYYAKPMPAELFMDDLRS